MPKKGKGFNPTLDTTQLLTLNVGIDAGDDQMFQSHIGYDSATNGNEGKTETKNKESFNPTLDTTQLLTNAGAIPGRRGKAFQSHIGYDSATNTGIGPAAAVVLQVSIPHWIRLSY